MDLAKKDAASPFGRRGVGKRRAPLASLWERNARLGGWALREALLLGHADNLHPVLDVFSSEWMIEVEGDDLILYADNFCRNGLDISRRGPTDVFSYGKVFTVGDFIGGKVL